MYCPLLPRRMPTWLGKQKKKKYLPPKFYDPGWSQMPHPTYVASWIWNRQMTTRPDIDFAAKTNESYSHSLKYFWKDAPYKQVVEEAKACGANDVEGLERTMRPSRAY